MATLADYKALSYQEVGLIPSIGQIDSRNKIKMSGYRIIISSVSSIVSKELIKEMVELPKEMRPSLAIPRTENAIEYLDYAVNLGLAPWIIPCIGINTPEIEDYIVQKGCFDKVLVDIAHGTTVGTRNLGHKLHAKLGTNVEIICGSVSTVEGAVYLINNGFDTVRTGIGTSSSICSTAFKTGVRVGSFTEVFNIYQYLGETEHKILADGGFLYPGDYAKAMLAGANYCMGATIFSDLKNAKCNLDGSGVMVGMSNKNKGVRVNAEYDESFVTKVNIDPTKLVSLYDKLKDIWGGIRSAVSYCGFESLEDAIGKGEFCELKTPLKRTITEINNINNSFTNLNFLLKRFKSKIITFAEF